MTKYLTIFVGDLTLNDGIDSATKSKIKKTISDHYDSVMNYNEQANVIYFSGDFDNGDELIEKFIVKISPLISESAENKVEAQGENREDKHDLIVKKHKLYIQDYNFVKSELRMY